MRVRSLLLLLLLVGCDESEFDVCTAEGLTSALEAASTGSVVVAGACRVAGNFRVPEGARLQGVEGSEITGTGDVITLEEGASLVNLSVQVNAGRAVVAAANHMLESVRIRVMRGIGVQATGTGTWSGVSLEGSLDPMRPDLLPPLAGLDAGDYLVVVEAGELEIADLNAARGGPWGVIVADSELNLQGGTIENIVGIGLYATNSTVSLTNVNVLSTQQGLQPFPAHAIATVDTDLTINGGQATDSDGLGVRMDGGTGTWSGVAIETNRLGGAWLQDGARATLTDATFMDNGLAGLVARAGTTLSMSGGSVLQTQLGTTRDGDRVLEVGDGLQIDRDVELNLSALQLVNNARVGLVVERGPSTRFTLSGVRIEGEGAALGAILQEGGSALSPPSEWNAGIERSAALSAQDAARVDGLPLSADLAALPAVSTR